VNGLEDFVGGLVPTSSFPPALNDAPIVPKNLEVSISVTVLCEGDGEEEKTDCFGPPDVPASVPPSWEEAPRSP
jgi:hypothetical protein